MLCSIVNLLPGFGHCHHSRLSSPIVTTHSPPPCFPLFFLSFFLSFLQVTPLLKEQAACTMFQQCCPQTNVFPPQSVWVGGWSGGEREKRKPSSSFNNQLHSEQTFSTPSVWVGERKTHTSTISYYTLQMFCHPKVGGGRGRERSSHTRWGGKTFGV